MTRTRKFIIAFWIVIVILGIWQFHDYNAGLDEKAKKNPEKHFFYYPAGTKPPGAAAVPTAAARSPDADVRQTAFTVEKDEPSTGSFTCHVTLQNKGMAKAVGVEVMVRPYRGVQFYDEDVGHQTKKVLSDDDPVSKIGEYVSFPDLGPGESSTQTVTFVSRPEIQPGTNPNPDIMFKTEKLPPHHSQADQ